MNFYDLDKNCFTMAAWRGFRVFPILAGEKTPAVAWKKYADRPPTEEELNRWDAGDYNIGVITGAPSRTIVLDVDDAEAQAFVDLLGLPPTPTVSTGKGTHYYFEAPPFELRNRTGIAGHKLDLRGDGGYVVGAGSIHPSGRRYEWVVSPDDVPFAPLPSQLLRLIQEKHGRPSISRRATDGPAEGDCGVTTRFEWYLERSLGEALKAIRDAEEGERNNVLFLAGAPAPPPAYLL